MIKKEIPVRETIKVEISLVDILVAMIIWSLLIVITLGLATIFFFYYFNKMVINHTHIIDKSSKRIAKLENNLSFPSILPHAALWLVIIIFTLGIGFFFFRYAARIFVDNHTKINSLKN